MVEFYTTNKYRQKGAISIMAVMTMIVLGIFLAGLMPLITSQLKANSNNQERLQAQYAAEAGVKRAIVCLAKLGSEANNKTPTNVSWGWLNQDQALDITPGTSATYRVAIRSYDTTTSTYNAYNPPAIPGTLPDNKYRVESVGKKNKESNTIYAIVDVTNGNLDFKTISWIKK